jgi:hypothetical protein
MFLVLAGELGGFAGTSVPDELDISAPEFRFAAGSLCGELAFALKRPRTATIWCLQDTAMLAFSYGELVEASPDPDVRQQLREAVNRTIRPRIVEHVARTAPYLAGGGGPLLETEATWSRLRRSSRLVSFAWPENQCSRPSCSAARRSTCS